MGNRTRRRKVEQDLQVTERHSHDEKVSLDFFFRWIFTWAFREIDEQPLHPQKGIVNSDWEMRRFLPPYRPAEVSPLSDVDSVHHLRL